MLRLESNPQTAVLDASGESPNFASLAESATLDFFSTMQLLAERARFVTGAVGVVIAVKEGSDYLYCASSGVSAGELGAKADITKPLIGDSLTTLLLALSPADTAKHEFARAIFPVVQSDEVIGFLELTADRPSFSENDVNAIARLAEMVSTALEHRNAAENAGNRIFDSKLHLAPQTQALWHAPVEGQPSEVRDAPAAEQIAKVHTCQSCGFPVSEGRALCVECERNPNAHPLPAPALSVEEGESWISAHGYTIASLLVTALIAAIIYWLR